MPRAAARPPVRLLAALLHAACVLLGPGLHLWLESGCGCAHAPAARAVRKHAACGHAGCRHHQGSDAACDADAAGEPSSPGHDPDDCPVCREFALARVAAPAVRLTVLVADAPHVPRPLPPRRPSLLAADVSCRGPPATAAGV